LPEQVVQEYAQRVHPESVRPSQFFVDLLRIKALCLLHFQLVNCIRRNIVAAHKPGLLRVPRNAFASDQRCACALIHAGNSSNARIDKTTVVFV
jgi:hypothetical protein